MPDKHKYIRSSDGSDIPGRTILALGSFDGFHMGHRAIACRTAELAAQTGAVPCALSFSVPPAVYLGGAAPKLLTAPEEKSRLFKETGIQSTLFIDFPDIRDLNAEEFITRVLIGECHAEGTVCGFNYSFGKGRTGTPEMLALRFGSAASVLPPVIADGEPVSSSRIRRLIADGDVESAARLLCRFYTLTYPVIHGRGDGSRLGFPTINQLPEHDRALPAAGVYVSMTTLGDGRRLPSVTDVGTAPTLDTSGIIRIETHLLAAVPRLYGDTVSVSFIRRIRPEICFGNADELRQRIAADSDYAARTFADDSRLGDMLSV